MVLPGPVLSDDDSKVATAKHRNPSDLISNTWSEDLTKLAVLRAMASCLARLGPGSSFDANIASALIQKPVCFLHSYLIELEEVHC